MKDLPIDETPTKPCTNVSVYSFSYFYFIPLCIPLCFEYYLYLVTTGLFDTWISYTSTRWPGVLYTSHFFKFYILKWNEHIRTLADCFSFVYKNHQPETLFLLNILKFQENRAYHYEYRVYDLCLWTKLLWNTEKNHFNSEPFLYQVIRILVCTSHLFKIKEEKSYTYWTILKKGMAESQYWKNIASET